jgi:hypothetical protein
MHLQIQDKNEYLHSHIVSNIYVILLVNLYLFQKNRCYLSSWKIYSKGFVIVNTFIEVENCFHSTLR